MATAIRLAELIRPSGKFLYRYDPAQPGKAEESKYNVLRHAGCIWALNQAASALAAGELFPDARKRALSWLFRTHLCISPQAGLCIAESGKAKLGGNALAVLALLSFPEEVSIPGQPHFTGSAELIEKLCDHMLSQITPDGDFVHERDMRTGAIEDFRSEYYTGEALFALLTALNGCPDPAKLRTTEELFHNLASREYGIAQQSHWMMYATEIAYAIAPAPATLAYADKLADNIMTYSRYRQSGRCTPIACRTEALLSYLRILRCAGRADLVSFSRAEDTIRTNLLLQLRDRLPDGAFRRGGGNSTVRIDYLQHNLATYLGYVEFAA